MVGKHVKPRMECGNVGLGMGKGYASGVGFTIAGEAQPVEANVARLAKHRGRQVEENFHPKFIAQNHRKVAGRLTRPRDALLTMEYGWLIVISIITGEQFVYLHQMERTTLSRPQTAFFWLVQIS